jgi:hypothetical protein
LADGHLVVGDSDRGEACVPQPVGQFVFVGQVKAPARSLSGGLEELVPGLVGVVLWEGVVVCKDADAEVGVFDPTAWLEASVGLLVQLRPVGDAADQLSDVDIVK